MYSFRFSGGRYSAILALTAFAAILGCSVEPAPENVVRQYEKAVNSKSVDSVMKLYSDDIIFQISSRLNVSGTDELRGIAEHDSVLNTNLSMANYLTKGDSVYCTITEKNDYLTAAGLTTAYYPQAVFVVNDGKISSIRAAMADSTSEELKEALVGFKPWVEENYPDTLKEIYPEGIFVHNGKNAEMLLSLLREWKEKAQEEISD